MMSYTPRNYLKSDMHITPIRNNQKSSLRKSISCRKITKSHKGLSCGHIPISTHFHKLNSKATGKLSDVTKKRLQMKAEQPYNPLFQMIKRNETFVKTSKPKAANNSSKSVGFPSKICLVSKSCARIKDKSKEKQNSKDNKQMIDTPIIRLAKFIGHPKQIPLLTKYATWSTEILTKVSQTNSNVSSQNITKNIENLKCTVSENTLKEKNTSTHELKKPSLKTVNDLPPTNWGIGDKLDERNRASLYKTAIGRRLLAGSMPKRNAFNQGSGANLHRDEIDSTLDNLKSRLQEIRCELELVQTALDSVEQRKLELIPENSVYTKVI